MKMIRSTQVKGKAGMTLLELTVVILVLLSLISILFVGARAWKKGSDRAGCIMNIRNVQQAVRGYMNMHPETATGPTADKIYGSAGTEYMKTPTCPGGGTYTYAADSVDAGAVFLTCSLSAEADGGHAPADTATW